mmetsp:Transcript_30352/g.70031  ORF Transcript_30352/g.70031 Transcript_30352/m.70031 type:complete len:142 (+) Transcript_30352:214-639(+)
MSWVTITHVIPSSSLSDSSICNTMWEFLVSKSPVGSSSNKICGRLANARAIVTRCCSPPDNCEGKWCSRWPMPTLVKSSIPRCRLCPGESEPSRVMGISTFSIAVKEEIRLNVWKTKPNLVRRSLANSDSGVFSPKRMSPM